MKTTVIYHRADFDGLFSREIAKKFLPEAELIGWDYGDPKISFPDDGKVYVIDLSPECFTLTTDNLPMRADGGFDGTYDRLVWIDHHKSAIEKFPTYIPGYRIDGVAACRLAWQWFGQSGEHAAKLCRWDCIAQKQDFIDRTVSEPLAVRLAGEYDIWDKRDPRAELFQHGLRSMDLDECWQHLLSTLIKDQDMVAGLLNRGQAIQYAKTQENEGIIKSYGFDVEFEGLKFLACNHARFNSHLFKAGIRPDHDALLGFVFDGKQFRVSLYGIDGRKEIDLSVIAVKYGGGGHRGACGFRVYKLPFIS